MKEKFRRFMMGRYGSDYLNRFILILAILLMLISCFWSNRILPILGWMLTVLACLRMFSRKTYQRQHENMVYWKYRTRVMAKLVLQRNRWRDRKTHRYFCCPSCHAAMRVPKGSGKIRITCRKCGHEFERKA